MSSAFYVPTLKAEGALAARTGDRGGAIAAYRRYLAFREEAEPGLHGHVTLVRVALEGLVHGVGVRRGSPGAGGSPAVPRRHALRVLPSTPIPVGLVHE